LDLRLRGYDSVMNEQEREKLSEDELEEQDAELLPDREEMTMLPIEPTGSGHTLPIEPPPTE
jgi:hypothetical protein